jgi:hypothetical protein
VSKANFLPRKVNENFVMFMTFLPSDWTTVGETGRYVRGGAVFGSMGGSASHVHTASGTTGGPSAITRASTTTGSSTNYLATYSHTHTYSFTTSSAPNTPSYLNVITASPNANVDLVSGTLALFDNLPPLGWEALSLANGRLFRIDSYYGATGGGPHTHTASGSTSNESAQVGLYASYDYTYTPTTPHSHSFSIETDPAEAMPPYITVRVAKRISQVSTPTVWGQVSRP